jgi:hypothetical protein
MVDVVVFRRWQDRSGDVIALFPELPADVQGRYCQSYMQVGQHGGADYHSVIQHTVPVGPKQYAALAQELRLVGYNLRPMKHASRRHHDKRRATARQMAVADTTSSNKDKR